MWMRESRPTDAADHSSSSSSNSSSSIGVCNFGDSRWNGCWMCTSDMTIVRCVWRKRLAAMSTLQINQPTRKTHLRSHRPFCNISIPVTIIFGLWDWPSIERNLYTVYRWISMSAHKLGKLCAVGLRRLSRLRVADSKNTIVWLICS